MHEITPPLSGLSAVINALPIDDILYLSKVIRRQIGKLSKIGSEL